MRVWPLLLVFLTACGTTPPQPATPTPPGRKIVRRVTKPAPRKSAPILNASLIQRLNQKDVVVIDVRSAEEYYNGHLRGAKNIDFLKPDFEKSVNKLDRSKSYYLYCASGNRSGKARRYLLARGVKAESLPGYEVLKNQGLPVEGFAP